MCVCTLKWRKRSAKRNAKSQTKATDSCKDSLHIGALGLIYQRNHISSNNNNTCVCVCCVCVCVCVCMRHLRRTIAFGNGSENCFKWLQIGCSQKAKPLSCPCVPVSPFKCVCMCVCPPLFLSLSFIHFLSLYLSVCGCAARRGLWPIWRTPAAPTVLPLYSSHKLAF